jgi:hypothetical protein
MVAKRQNQPLAGEKKLTLTVSERKFDLSLKRIKIQNGRSIPKILKKSTECRPKNLRVGILKLISL